jgi:XRE family transcriptional regulator, regulator of sulfur utilization
MPWPGAWYSRQSPVVPFSKKNAPLHADNARATSFDPEVARAFGVVVRSQRLALGIAQDQFALLANIDRSYFGKLERGQRQPSLALMLRVAAGLHCSGAELMRCVELALLDTPSTDVLAAIATPTQRSLYAHFSHNKALVLQLEKTVLESRSPGWRAHPPEVRKVRNAVRYILSMHIPLNGAWVAQQGEAAQPMPMDLDAEVDWVMQLVLACADYA